MLGHVRSSIQHCNAAPAPPLSLLQRSQPTATARPRLSTSSKSSSSTRETQTALVAPTPEAECKGHAPVPTKGHHRQVGLPPLHPRSHARRSKYPSPILARCVFPLSLALLLLGIVVHSTYALVSYHSSGTMVLSYLHSLSRPFPRPFHTHSHRFVFQGGFARVYEVKDTQGSRSACKVVTKSSLKTKKAKTKVQLKIYLNVKIIRNRHDRKIKLFRFLPSLP